MKIFILILLVFMSYDLRDWRKIGSSGKEQIKGEVMIKYFEERPDCGKAELEIYENIKTKEVDFFVHCEKQEI